MTLRSSRRSKSMMRRPASKFCSLSWKQSRRVSHYPGRRCQSHTQGISPLLYVVPVLRCPNPTQQVGRLLLYYEARLLDRLPAITLMVLLQDLCLGFFRALLPAASFLKLDDSFVNAARDLSAVYRQRSDVKVKEVPFWYNLAYKVFQESPNISDPDLAKKHYELAQYLGSKMRAAVQDRAWTQSLTSLQHFVETNRARKRIARKLVRKIRCSTVEPC